MLTRLLFGLGVAALSGYLIHETRRMAPVRAQLRRAGRRRAQPGPGSRHDDRR